MSDNNKDQSSRNADEDFLKDTGNASKMIDPEEMPVRRRASSPPYENINTRASSITSLGSTSSAFSDSSSEDEAVERVEESVTGPESVSTLDPSLSTTEKGSAPESSSRTETYMKGKEGATTKNTVSESADATDSIHSKATSAAGTEIRRTREDNREKSNGNNKGQEKSILQQESDDTAPNKLETSNADEDEEDDENDQFMSRSMESAFSSSSSSSSSSVSSDPKPENYDLESFIQETLAEELPATPRKESRAERIIARAEAQLSPVKPATNETTNDDLAAENTEPPEYGETDVDQAMVDHSPLDPILTRKVPTPESSNILAFLGSYRGEPRHPKANEVSFIYNDLSDQATELSIKLLLTRCVMYLLNPEKCSAIAVDCASQAQELALKIPYLPLLCRCTLYRGISAMIGTHFDYGSIDYDDSYGMIRKDYHNYEERRKIFPRLAVAYYNIDPKESNSARRGMGEKERNKARKSGLEEAARWFRLARSAESQYPDSQIWYDFEKLALDDIKRLGYDRPATDNFTKDSAEDVFWDGDREAAFGSEAETDAEGHVIRDKADRRRAHRDSSTTYEADLKSEEEERETVSESQKQSNEVQTVELAIRLDPSLTSSEDEFIPGPAPNPPEKDEAHTSHDIIIPTDTPTIIVTEPYATTSRKASFTPSPSPLSLSSSSSSSTSPPSSSSAPVSSQSPLPASVTVEPEPEPEPEKSSARRGPRKSKAQRKRDRKKKREREMKEEEEEEDEEEKEKEEGESDDEDANKSED